MFRKWWKKLGYWQKGGFIGGIIYSIVGLLTIILALNCDDGWVGLGCLGLFAPIYPAVILIDLIEPFMGWINAFPEVIATIIAGLSIVLSTFIVGFLAGAVIGLIIGRIRKMSGKIYKGERNN